MILLLPLLPVAAVLLPPRYADAADATLISYRRRRY